jgi:ribose 1,5-bisphosphate isomerase
MDEKTIFIINDIKELKIQGARNIAHKGVEALLNESESYKGRDVNEYLSNLIVASDLIAGARATEPMLRNFLQHIISKLTSSNKSSIKDMKKIVKENCEFIFDKLKKSKRDLKDYGSLLIKEGGTYYTHCHSSTVVSVLKEAFNDGINFSVIVSETRPKYQGLKTAKELSSHGIPTTLIVDSCAYSFIRKCDAVFLGGDSISVTGDLVNKVGSAGIAFIAHSLDIPVYSCVELNKFDPLTRWGMNIEIEERNPKEVYAGRKNKNLKIRNPAFDLVPAKYITAYITEDGLIPPQALISVDINI